LRLMLLTKQGRGRPTSRPLLIRLLAGPDLLASCHIAGIAFEGIDPSQKWSSSGVRSPGTSQGDNCPPEGPQMFYMSSIAYLPSSSFKNNIAPVCGSVNTFCGITHGLFILTGDASGGQFGVRQVICGNGRLRTKGKDRRHLTDRAGYRGKVK